MIQVATRIAFLCIGLALLALAVSPVSAAAQEAGRETFEKRCAKCHDLPDPGQPPPEGWAEQLELMAPMAGLKAREKADVLAYLQSHVKEAERAVSVVDERRLFEEKCSLCHTPDRVFLTPLTAESRRHIVLRMRQRAPDWISEEEAEAIVRYLENPQAVEQKKKVTGDPATLFRNRCTGCHTLERVYRELDEHKTMDWVHIVQRMQEKSPDWLSDTEARKVLEYLETLKPVEK